MKKFLNAVIFCLFAITILAFPVTAKGVFVYGYSFDLAGNIDNEITIEVWNLNGKDGTDYNVKIITDNLFDGLFDDRIQIEDSILSLAEKNDTIAIFEVIADNEENPYPEIESMKVCVESLVPGGGRNYLGKDYRIFYFDGDTAENLNGNIFKEGKMSVQFTADKLGKYVVYFNPDVYNVIFYSDDRQYDEDENFLNPECVYAEFQNMGKYEIVDFPKIPEKEGCVFTGWLAWSGSGLHFVGPQPIKAVTYYDYQASWCPENEYEPINIEISANEPIIKGKENGAKITIKTNYGAFVREYFPSEWRGNYEEAETEEDKAEILAYWKEYWNVVGTDEILVETAERIDDQTVELTLSGNSSDVYRSTDIQIEFSNELLSNGYDEYGDSVILHEDAKIKMDEDGVRAKMYRSDNSITLKKQSRPSSGGGGTARFAVSFETDGGSEVKTQYVKRGELVEVPETPEKEGFDFGGWFSDKELIREYDFSETVTKGITLYAKWEKESKIIFTIGEKEVVVSGEKKAIDAKPVIKNDRAFLPARYVAESLGAEVLWSEVNRTVTITKGKTEIVIVIGESEALVNDERVNLDYPAYIENGRTYTPMRFIAEKLGAEVFWEEESRMIYIVE